VLLILSLVTTDINPRFGRAQMRPTEGTKNVSAVCNGIGMYEEIP